MSMHLDISRVSTIHIEKAVSAIGQNRLYISIQDEMNEILCITVHGIGEDKVTLVEVN